MFYPSFQEQTFIVIFLDFFESPRGVLGSFSPWLASILWVITLIALKLALILVLRAVIKRLSILYCFRSQLGLHTLFYLLRVYPPIP